MQPPSNKRSVALESARCDSTAGALVIADQLLKAMVRALIDDAKASGGWFGLELGAECQYFLKSVSN
jgi:hypothetical protein